jgi:TolB-like protein
LSLLKNDKFDLMRLIFKLQLILILSLILLCTILGCSSGANKMFIREIPRSQRDALMVLNFQNCTDEILAPAYQPWEYGLATMMMTDVESIGLFNIISREDLKKILEEHKFQHSGLVEGNKAVEIGKLLAARYILTGSFIVMNGTMRMESKVFSVEKGVLLGAASVSGKTKMFFDLEKQLVIEISNFLNVKLAEEEAAIITQSVETRSVDASLNNYAGEIAVIKSDELKDKGDAKKAEMLLEKARKNFKKALQYDPTFEKAKDNLDKLAMGIPMTL